MLNCDDQTGQCRLADDGSAAGSAAASETPAVRYVGDPMCSWCWGMAPAVAAVAAYCRESDIPFEVVLGGLRAGGGDAWDAAFRNFLRSEWERVARVTGQPFGFTLLERPHFTYDTEPACRAVVVARHLLGRRNVGEHAVLAFFAAIQQRFYVQGDDPKELSFYRELCEQAQLPFQQFGELFNSPWAHAQTQEQFHRTRELRVRSFPTLLLEHGGQAWPLTAGHATPESTLVRLRMTLDAVQRR